MKLFYLTLFTALSLGPLDLHAADKAATQASPVSKTAEAPLSFDELKSVGSEAVTAGNYEMGAKLLKQAKKLNPKDRVVRKLLAEAKWQLRQKADDAYAAKKGPRLGLHIAGIVLEPGDRDYGGGGQLMWLQPDPAKLPLGLALSGWYQPFRGQVIEAGVPHGNGKWGEIYSGRLQVEWLPGHGRGLRKKAFFIVAAGPGFVQTYRNEIHTQERGLPGTYLDYSAGLANTLGGGFSSKWGFDLSISATSLYCGGGFANLEEFISPIELSASLGYLF